MKPAHLAVLLCSMVMFAQTPCDPDLVDQVNKNDTDRYSPRGDRCEGVYLEQVSGTVGNILVASLVVKEGRMKQWPVSLMLRWTPYAGGATHVQAFAVVPRKYFRLDAVRMNSASYDWNTGLLSKYLQPNETGVVAWTIASVNGRSQRVYLPVSVGPTEGIRAPYSLTVVPPADLSEVYLTVVSTIPGSQPVRDRVPLKYGSYPKNQKIDMDLPPLAKPGLYRVSVTGDRVDQGSVATPPFLVNIQ